MSGDLLDRAMRAYHQDLTAPYAGNSSSMEQWQGREYAVLRNINGTLAVYQVRKDSRLTRLAPEVWSTWEWLLEY